jgi:hypothetical protein
MNSVLEKTSPLYKQKVLRHDRILALLEINCGTNPINHVDLAIKKAPKHHDGTKHAIF